MKIKIGDDPIFILGCTKSGTSLLRNLFDGHPDLFVIPIESHFFQNTGHWVSYLFRTNSPFDLDMAQMKANLIDWVLFMNQRKNETADSFTSNQWDIDVLTRCINDQDVQSSRELFDVYVDAMLNSLKLQNDNSQIRFVEKSVEHAEFALELLQLYPKAKFIHIMRNPYANVVAIRKFRNSKNFPFLGKVFLSMYNSYYFLYKNKGLMSSDRYKIITYESLLAEPQEVMKDLAAFTGIAYTDKLLSPTLMHNEWKGNSTTGTKFKGINATNISKWKGEISNYEIYIINELFSHVLRDFGYEIIKPAKKYISFSKKENLKNYIMNRLLWYFMPRFDKKPYYK